MTDAGTPPAEAPPPRRWRALRWSRRTMLVLVAVAAAFLVSLVSLDLGPYLKGRAEQEASKFLERPMHIGKLSAALRPGKFILEDVVIEGLTPDAVPFLKADRIAVYLPWWTLLRRELTLQVEMDGWAVTIESFPGNRNNLPRLKPGPSSGPSAVSTVVNHVWARGGRFRLMDHAQPWEVITENTTVSFTHADNLDAYVATVGFAGGLNHMYDYQPMRLDSMSGRLRFDPGGVINVQGLDLLADGTRAHLQGIIEANNWPALNLEVRANFEVPRMKDIFFHGQGFTATGHGVFTGTFKKYQTGEHDIYGTFTTPLLDVSGLDFPGLSGRVVWVPGRLEVVGAQSGFYGGAMRLTYALDSRGSGLDSIADLSLTYTNVDLAAFGQAMEWSGIDLGSRADGWQTMSWPNGHFDAMRGDGEIRPRPADGVVLAAADLPAVAAFVPPLDAEAVNLPLGPLPVGGRVSYTLTPTSIELRDSWLATPETHLTFRGTTGWHDNANIPFRVASTDWQASDRLLAAVLTAFGSPTKAIEINGRGIFDATLTRWFSRPLIVGTFEGEGLRAWNVLWGHGRANVSIEDNYLAVSDSAFAKGDATLVANGRYSFSFPRTDGGDEIDARITAERWPLVDWRTFFALDDWPVEGTMFGDVRVYGRYRGPEGFGVLRVEPGTAWEETFETFNCRLSFELDGMRVDGAELTKSTGFVRGAAFVGWPGADGFGTYSVTFDGEKIPIESLVSFTVPDADLTGMLNFRMRGSGSTANPRYEWDGRVADLFWADEGIGQATALLIIQEDSITIERLDIASDRLSVSGSGHVDLNDAYDAEISMRFNETSVDPYLRFVAPQLSPYTQAVISGSTRIRGELADPSKLGVDLTIDRAYLRLFDYTLSNPIDAAGARVPLRMAFASDVLTICGIEPASASTPCAGSVGAFTLAGEGTSLTVSGRVSRADQTIDVSLDGTSSLAVLQGVVQDVRSSGDATVAARVTGTFERPVYGGMATITNGRLRHFSFPHSLDNINGTVQFDATGIRLDGLRARMGTGGRTGRGEIAFGGSIGLEGFMPGRLNVTASGNNLDLRFPEGFRSTVDADLSVTGTTENAMLAGRITVRQARYTRRLQSNGLFGFASVGGGDPAVGVSAIPTELPIAFNVELVGQRLLVVDDSDATVLVSPDLTLTGTLDQPVLSGRVDIDRGETEFLGNRYTIDGAVEFVNPDRIEPYFVIEARTQIRQPLQEYRLTLTFQGTLATFTYNLDSDPPLAETDIMSLILGQNPNLQRSELRALESQEAQNQLMSQLVAQLVASPISTEVGRVVERTGLVDTFSVTPLLGVDSTFQSLNPGARVTVGRRISQRVYLTYSRSLDNTSLDHEILLVEYAQNDRMSWVLSRNEDGTFALDFRVRYRF